MSLPWVRRLLALTPPHFIPTVYIASGALCECNVSLLTGLKLLIGQKAIPSDPGTIPVARPTVSAPVSQRSAGGGLKAAARHVGMKAIQRTLVSCKRILDRHRRHETVNCVERPI